MVGWLYVLKKNLAMAKLQEIKLNKSTITSHEKKIYRKAPQKQRQDKS